MSFAVIVSFAVNITSSPVISSLDVIFSPAVNEILLPVIKLLVVIFLFASIVIISAKMLPSVCTFPVAFKSAF